jgi:hypothetical protein
VTTVGRRPELRIGTTDGETDMGWVQFEVTGVTGRPVTLGVKVRLDVVECWVGGQVAVLDRDVFIDWLAAPDESLIRHEVAFEADPDGVAVSFAGRVRRTVIRPGDVERLVATVRRPQPASEPPPDRDTAVASSAVSTGSDAAGPVS